MNGRPQNSAERFLIAGQAAQCVTWLKLQGFEVLCVEGGPRITIRNSPLCKELEGVTLAYDRTSRGERRYRYVMRFDCMIVWDDIADFSGWEVRQEQAYWRGAPVLKRLLHAVGGAA